MQDKAAVNRLIEKYYSVKRPNRIQREAEQKIKSNLKLSLSTTDIKPSLPYKKKNFFAPINNFISLSSTHLDIPDLYKNQIIPSQTLKTSKKIINRLTRRVYFSVTNKQNGLIVNKLNSECKLEERKKRKRVALSFGDMDRNKSFEVIHKNCDELIKDNKNSLKYFLRKNKALNREVRSTQNMVNRLKNSKDYKENKEFFKKLIKCHSVLGKVEEMDEKNK